MELSNNLLFSEIKEIILQSRQRVFRMANSVLLETYWQIGRIIIEDELQGKIRAEYGKSTLKNLGFQLTLEFGKGFDERNLNNMKAFYKAFPIWNALRTELSWTHYRLISRIDYQDKRNFYLKESIDNNWNSRTLQRQINSMAFERVLEYKNDNSEKPTIQNLIKDPYIFEF